MQYGHCTACATASAMIDFSRALSEREKSLIALAVAHTVQCPYCIDAYTKDTLEKGCDVDQLTEAVHVAAAIRGGSSLVHGVQMRNHATKISM